MRMWPWPASRRNYFGFRLPWVSVGSEDPGAESQHTDGIAPTGEGPVIFRVVTRKYQARECERCERLFWPTGSRQGWCLRCRTIQCRTCRTKFVATPSRIHAGTAIYCSRPCMFAGRDFRSDRECTKCGNRFISHSARKVVCDQCCTVACAVCGTTRRVKPYYVNSARYCSYKCRDRAQSSFVFTKQNLAFIKQNYPFKMSAKQIAEKLGAPPSAVERFIATKLDLPPCPIGLRNQRSGKARRVWTKYRVIQEVKDLHRRKEANSAFVQQNHPSLHTAACNRFGSWRAAVEAAGIDYKDVNLYSARRTWTREDIVVEIQRMEAQGVSLRASDARDHNADVFNAARREPSLRTWGEAVDAAGFDYTEICEAPYGSRYQGTDGYIYRSRVEGLVGDRLRVLESRGLLSDLKRQVQVAKGRGWRCDFVVQPTNGERPIWIEVDGLGSARSGSEYDEHPKIQHYRRIGLAFAIVRTPAQAERVVRDGLRGMLTSGRDSPRKIIELGENRHTDDDIIEEMCRIGKFFGRAPTTAEFNARASMTSQTVSRRIGWNAALMRAGYLPRRGVPKEVVLGELGRVVSELGRAPTRAEFTALSSYNAATLTAHFSGWAAAMRAVGVEPVYEGHVWSKERVINEIVSLNKRLPRLTREHLNGEFAVYYAAQRLFGSWKLAIEAAGIEPRSRMGGWSRRFDACIKCRTTNNRHASGGQCVRCYENELRARRRG